MTDDVPTDDGPSTDPDDYSDDVAAALVAASNTEVDRTLGAMSWQQVSRAFRRAGWDELERRGVYDFAKRRRVTGLLKEYGTPDQMLAKAQELEG